MKIVVSSTGSTRESNLDRRFGRCNYFLIHDTDADTYDAIPNAGAGASGGAGIKAAGQVIDAKVDAIITGNLGPNAFDLIEQSGIAAYSCDIVSAQKAIELFQDNKLSKITTAGASHQGLR